MNRLNWRIVYSWTYRHSGEMIRCYFYSYQFSFIIEPSLWACLLPMVGFRSKRNVHIIQMNRKRWEFVSFGHSPNLQIKLSSVSHCANSEQYNTLFIASCKHGWEPIRARVTWVLFYNKIYNQHRVVIVIVAFLVLCVLKFLFFNSLRLSTGSCGSHGEFTQ